MNNYIQTMRRLVGQETLLTVGCGAIIEDAEGRILLQKRSGSGVWGIPGGILELGETFEEAVKREVLEETNLKIGKLSLFGLYSGNNGFAEYENGDKVFSVQIIFHTKSFEGNLQGNDESKELCFWGKNDPPVSLNAHQAPFIHDWIKNIHTPVIK